MKIFPKKLIGLTLILMVSTADFCLAQQGQIIVNQDPQITELLELKKELNSNEDSSKRYKIQIYSGRRVNGEKARSEFRKHFNQWSSKLVYETPNYKVWVGSFRSRLEADRALLKIKSQFPNAFIFKPKKKKESS